MAQQKSRGRRVPFTLLEDKNIVKFIIEKDVGPFVMGNTIWQNMQSLKICPGRTWQSLKNRFRRYLLKDLKRPELGLSPSNIEYLNDSIQQISKNSNNIAPKLLPADHDTSDSDVSLNLLEDNSVNNENDISEVSQLKNKSQTKSSQNDKRNNQNKIPAAQGASRPSAKDDFYLLDLSSTSNSSTDD